jgi:capsular exopolysaccharide synthesis family protein
MRNLFNNKITNDTDIAKETKLSVLGEIGHNSSGKTIVAEQNSRTALSEQFRALRTNLQFLLKGKEHQVIMLTSSASGEGKSFLTINLGSTIAISNKKVVLVELDLRKPKITKELGLAKEAGFTDYMISRLNKEDIIKSTSVHPNLFLISSGTIPPNPAELLLDKKTDELFAWLRTQFDYIIVDTPPAGVVIDPVLISKHADAAIYVVRQKYTLKEQLKMINEFKQTEKLPNLSLLVNDVKLSRVYGYKYGYKYGYHYGYGSNGYYTDEKKNKWKFLKRKKVRS